jgi:DNA modification methylase
MREFAPDQHYEEVCGNRIYEFPTDTEWRKELFTEESMRHPAKMNLYLLKAIIDFVSNPGERVMDIMSGTGSIMIAALAYRKVTVLELSEKYYGWILKSKEIIESKFPATLGLITVINGACQDVLPLPTNHIIFSPPYANIMKKKFGDGQKRDLVLEDLYGTKMEDFIEYADSPKNVGSLNRFFYNQAMQDIYKLCYDSIEPGGTLTIVIKDYIEKGKRVYLSDWVIRSCIRLGFEQLGWFKWLALGGPFVRIRRARGEPTVDEEDIMTFRKPALQTVPPIKELALAYA